MARNTGKEYTVHSVFDMESMDLCEEILGIDMLDDDISYWSHEEIELLTEFVWHLYPLSDKSQDLCALFVREHIDELGFKPIDVIEDYSGTTARHRNLVKLRDYVVFVSDI